MRKFHYRELTKTEGLWVSIEQEAEKDHHIVQGVVAGFSSQPRCAVSDDGFFYGLDAHGKEITKTQATEIGLLN